MADPADANLHGTPDDDWLHGGGGAVENRLKGGAGANTLIGGAGTGWLRGYDTLPVHFTVVSRAMGMPTGR
ncbi:hypothetical protein [Phyllobacterium sp. 1468]|uniref:hypothetical protein n=1 Tax=Phyllobacterium sp. 1468 TaxID=2817759 RepID=UPI0038620EE2